MSSSVFRRVPVNIICLALIFAIVLFHQRAILPSSLKYSYFNTSLSKEFSLERIPSLTQSFPTSTSQLVCPPTLTPSPPEPQKTSAPKKSFEEATIASLREEGIVVIFKTGALEESHLAIHLGTTLRYFEEDDILFFSDLQGTLGPFVITDALQFIDQHIRETHPEFQIYRDLQAYRLKGQDVTELKQDKDLGDDRAGWKLDKYKFLHMTEQTYIARPAAKWYVFIETDSYVIWPNLVKWLKGYDSTKSLYMGSAVQMGNTMFAHGGTGYVISNAAMNKLLGPERTGLASSWDLRLRNECCGDYALALALKEHGVTVMDVGPYMNGNKPSTFRYGPDLWCQAVVTMHHLVPHDVNNIWRYERRRERVLANPNETTTFSEFYFHFMEPQLTATRENWDNLSEEEVYTEPKKEVETEKEQANFHENEDGKEENDDEEEEEGKGSKDYEKLPDEQEVNDRKDNEKKIDDEKKAEEYEKKNQEKEDIKKSDDNEKFPSANKLHKRTEHENAWKSFEHCGEACSASPSCFQYLYYEYTCKLQNSFAIGKYKEPSDNGKVVYKSGWMVARIREWTEKHECDDGQKGKGW